MDFDYKKPWLHNEAPIGQIMRDGADSYGAYVRRMVYCNLGASGSLVESPIEQLFATAYMAVVDEARLIGSGSGNGSLDNLFNHEINESYFQRNPNLLRLDSILFQRSIDKYRVDFILERWERDYICVGSSTASCPEVMLKARVIVECDGHDFHERTKEQAERDKSRDRELQALGYPVYRFTGSEIWRSAYRCASEANAFLSGLIIQSRTQQQEIFNQGTGGHK
jgi:very-short-patch-repair endonuclease